MGGGGVFGDPANVSPPIGNMLGVAIQQVRCLGAHCDAGGPFTEFYPNLI